jgi:transcriptional regulator with XRE-family HTH domain
MNQDIDVKALRERLGWTQDDLAKELGLDRSSVSRLEHGQKAKGPTSRMLKMIADRAPESEPGAASPDESEGRP